MLQIVYNLKNLLYPPKVKCIQCSQESILSICPYCISSIHFIEGITCSKCGRELDLHSKSLICKECGQKSYNFDKAIACMLYDGMGKELIHKFKYNGAIEMADFFGGLMSKRMEEYGENIDCITYVPLHSEREQERGYNQSEILADKIGEIMGIPVKDLLIRKRKTQSQYKLKAQERHINVKNAFEVKGTGIYGKNILLIDDIFTTGSTGDACSEVLRAAGAKIIIFLTLANGSMT